MKEFVLSNKNIVPSICFGPGMIRGIKPKSNLIGKVNNKITYELKRHVHFKAILSAMKNGYRFIDNSASYGIESLIRSAIKTSKVDRGSFILTTRVSNKSQFNNTVEKDFFHVLEEMELDYIDLLMFHWPVNNYYLDTYKKMESLYHRGYVKNLGVANCHKHHLLKLLQISDVAPVINQVELHPLFTQKDLLCFCKNNNIVVQAYTPLARFDDRLFRLPDLKRIAREHDKTEVQIILRWHIQNGVIPVFRSLNSSRQKENINIFDFSLSESEMRVIDGFNINSRLRYDPDNCDFTIL